MLKQLATLALLSAAHGSSLSDSLESLMYLNKGVATNKDPITIVEQPTCYWEPENVTRARYAWADVGTVPMVYATTTGKCLATSAVSSNTDLPGGDYRQIANTDISSCQQACCDQDSCLAWAWTQSAVKWNSCVEGQPCCYLKSSVPTASAHSGISSGTVTRKPYGAEQAPPTGIRSAPPLGGLACGTVELRADGTLTAWTMENNSPAGSAKLSKQNLAFFGARVKGAESTWARVLQTKPIDRNLEGVDSLTFGGSPPTTRLEVGNAPAGMDIKLFGYSRFASGDMRRSHLPAVAFSMVFKNTGSTAQDVSAFFNLPSVQENTERWGTALRTDTATTPEACQKSCNGEGACASWMFNGTCVLQSTSPNYAFQDGVWSGTKTFWSQGNCLTMDKPGTGSMNGNYSLCGTGGSVKTSTGGYDDMWTTFVAEGSVDGKVDPNAGHGAISVSGSVAPGETAVLTVVLGYYFPLHNYLNQVLGNQYTNFFDDSEGPALELLGDLEGTLADIHNIHKPILGSSLPTWMSDTLVATLHHVRSAMWYTDGRWRQWEAYDCVNVDSVHNDGERHIPYIMLFPESTKSKIEAWGRAQGADGMINEQLACGCMGGIDAGFEHGCGRVMSDVSSMYIIYLLELLKWNNDQDFVRTWYPTVRKAAEWQISVSTFHGMPTKLQTTYDVLDMQGYQAVTYSTAFQIVCMKAMAELAEFMNIPSDVTRYTNAAEAALQGMESMLWQEDMKAYMAYYEPEHGRAIMGDTFYAQVLAHSVGLGTVMNETRLRMHLDTEAKTNSDPFGLKILTGRTSGNSITEADIWMMAPADHAALALRIGQNVNDAMEIASRPYLRLTEGINDVWNAAGVLRGNYTNFPGSQYLTAHYGYYMTIWHTMLAMSGQVIDVHSGTFAFSPAMSTPQQERDFLLPMMLPNVVGYVNGSVIDGSYHVGLCVTTGVVDAKTVSWWGVQYPTSVQLKGGECISMKM